MTDRFRRLRKHGRWIAVGTALAALGIFTVLSVSQSVGLGSDLYGYGDIELSVKSDYSRIRVRRDNSTRTLSFVRDSGEEVVESMVNLRRPHDLLVSYTRYMFLSYVFRPRPERVLIVGLGGGSMVHFLKHHDPNVKVDVVEIDGQIVKIADKYFGVRTEGNVNVVTGDGAEYLKKTKNAYDVIYMDAFLKPSDETDSTGVPLRLKTVRFYKEIQKKLAPDGLVVYNLNPHSSIRDDVNNIREAFPQTYVFELPNLSGLVVVGSMTERRLSPNAIVTEGSALDRRFRASYSFRAMASMLVVR
jgi:spermidine synthase